MCVILKPKSYTEIALSKKRLTYASYVPEGVDVQIFQQLPAYIRSRVISDGIVKYVADDGMLFDLAFETHRMFEDYKPIYKEYLKGVADAG